MVFNVTPLYRLRQIQAEDERREAEKHLQIQAKLDQISRKYNADSTYLPPPAATAAPGASNTRRGGRGGNVNVTVTVDGHQTDNRSHSQGRPPRSMSGKSGRRVENNSLPAIPGASNGGGSVSEYSGASSSNELRSRSEQQATRKDKAPAPTTTLQQTRQQQHQPQLQQYAPRAPATNSTAQRSGSGRRVSNVGSHGGNTNNDEDDDEWLRDDEPSRYGGAASSNRGHHPGGGGANYDQYDYANGNSRGGGGGYDEDDVCDEDSIEASRQSSSAYRTNNHSSSCYGNYNNGSNKISNNSRPMYSQGNYSGNGGAYNSHANDEDDENLSDISGGEGAPVSSARQPSKIKPSQANIQVGSKATSSNGGNKNIYTKSSDKIIPLVQLNQQHIASSQHGDSTKKTSATAHSSNKKSAIWRELKPLPILPYKPIPTSN